MQRSLQVITARIGVPIAIASVAAGILLVAVRAYYAISVDEPLQLYTSGAEHESLLSIWKEIRGQLVYADPHDIPFAASYYNWLYYWIYGALAGFSLDMLGLADPWLPTVTRAIMLLSAVGGAGLLYWSLVRLFAPRTAQLRVIAALLALFVFFGPLAGFWVITTNVELWALIATIAAMHAFVGAYPRRPLAAVLWFCVFAYAAWALKQIYVYSILTVGLYLLWRRDWRNLAIAVAVLAAAFAFSFAIGSTAYRTMMLHAGTAIPFSWAQVFTNLQNVALKTLPITLPLLWLALRGRIKGGGIFWLGAAVSALIIVPASAKVGAAENYYFPLVYFLAAALYASLCAGKSAEPAFSLGWLANAAGVLAVLAGFAGVLSTRDWHPRLTALQACIAPLPKPAFSAVRYGALPWMNSGGPYFVPGYNYAPDRAAGIPFERGGIGGLIEEGYFAALLLPPGTETTFDSGRLSRYTRVGACADVDVWVRRG